MVGGVNEYDSVSVWGGALGAEGDEERKSWYWTSKNETHVNCITFM